MLLEIDGSESTLWLYTASGVNGDAGVGLCRSLNKEYPLCKIRLAIFDGLGWTKETMSAFVFNMNAGNDSIFYVDRNRQVTVPRVVSTSAPTKRKRFDAHGSWELDQTGFKMNSPQKVEPNAVVVRAIAFSSLLGRLRVFVGRLHHVGTQSSFSEGDLVVGITHLANISNTFTVQDAFIVKLEHDFESVSLDIARTLMPLFIVHVGCGNRRRVNPGHKILLIRDENQHDSAMRWYLDSLGCYVTEWDPKSSSLADLHELVVGSSTILSGTTQLDVTKMLKMCRRPTTRLFLWNDPEEGLDAMITEDPSIVSESLKEILFGMKERWGITLGGGLVQIENLVLPSQGDLVPSDSTLFSPTKAYVLIGGIGGVGIHVALWMYQVWSSPSTCPYILTV